MPNTAKDKETWIKQYWRPLMAYQYFAVCLFDFIIFPALTMLISKYTGQHIQWDPLTLKESGFYHMAMGAILGVAAWTRGLEKIKRIEAENHYSEEIYNEKTRANMRGE